MPGFDPNEPRDKDGKWTGIPGYISKGISTNLRTDQLAQLTDAEKELLKKDYATEQEFRDAYQKIISERERGSAVENKTGGENGGPNGSNSEVSEQEKEWLHQSVIDYRKKYGSQFEFSEDFPTNVQLDENRSREIAREYANLVSNPNDPAVVKAYGQLGKEVDAQYNFITKDLGVKVNFSENDPYANSKAMVRDVALNHKINIYKGGEDHPLLGSKTTDADGITLNEKFRAVHDFFGHSVEGNQFGKVGEEKAWVAHSKMFSVEARKALTTETRGQNSWVNFSGANYISLKNMNDGNRLINQGNVAEGKKLVELGQKQFKFAEQKVALLPERFIDYKIYKKNKT